MERLRENALFLTKFLRNPTKVGAIVPSSDVLAERIVCVANVKNARSVVELGPGTGAFTDKILDTLSPNAEFLAVEANPELAVLLRKKFPDARIIAGSAEHLVRICRTYQIETVDSVISGLPWAVFDDTLQHRILDAVHQILTDGGVFATFAYLHSCWFDAALRFRDKIYQHFSHVEKTPVVWRNVPPAFIYRCVK